MDENNFESKLMQLEKIVTDLENGDVPLEAAITKFQEGMVLTNDLEKTLQSAEQVLVKAINADNSESDFTAEQKAY
ncbi:MULTISPECIES: exodeoxyribonuclease VII small subunit [Lactococcus]|uniref:Exodeoxyribonuclease 7 small subunit n=1 Tax=Lactococcus lactis subsp. cremoris TaxID=1359 RepID=A0A1V0PDA4_LACLC|nr:MULTISPECIES: exodeoxyribonuclease VII small subunit [Lactococcus]ARE27247.1 exodeoxyribonuclease VII small subunit [Lactococcus cremoris]KZK43532.1 Exodeoxyribonuclease VII small subunit [Lactococcus cremoris]MDT2914452.1 exodeoxyribonuclease VII small subunit [Lactococcus lactis]MDT2938587.1 exodeoxyribonuclease VII small subunit [Lactococcus lactis]